MEPETTRLHGAPATAPDPAPAAKHFSATRWTIVIALALWGLFFALDRAFPYMKNGSDLVMSAKVRLDASGNVFPEDPRVERVVIFGNSKTLTGFLPSLFDQMAAQNRLNVASFNSGFPGSTEFLKEFEALCARGQAPHVVLLTLPWQPDSPKRNLFHLIQDDHGVIERLFPFRYWLRDFAGFLMSAAEQGGVRSFYRMSRADAQLVVRDRGYYFITEQSHFKGGRLPDDFHLASDHPDVVDPRIAPPPNAQTQELNRLVQSYRIRCYFVPTYLRIGEAAPPPARDLNFSTTVEHATPCKVLGPDYFLFPNHLFSDQIHMNPTGAEEYTRAVFQLVQNELNQVPGNAVQ